KWQTLDAEQQSRVLRGHERIAEQIESLGERGQNALQLIREGGKLVDPWTRDDRFWALGMTLVTIALLYNGRYGIVQNLSVAMVVAFTFITIGNVCALQTTERWSLSLDEFLRGFKFTLPQGDD